MSPNVVPVLSPSSASVSIQGIQNVKITNENISTINTEQSVALTNNLKTLKIRFRGAAIVKYSFVSGESGSNYFTIPNNCSEEIENLDLSGKSIYFQSSKTGVLEIVELY